MSYTWLKGEPQISTKEIFITRYLQHRVLGDSVILLVFSVYVHYYICIYIHHYIYIELPDRYFSRILLDKISLVIILKLRKS